MKKSELLDSIYVVHVLAAMVLVYAHGDLVALLSGMDANHMSLRSLGFAGIAVLISGLLICYGAIAFHWLKELPLLCLILLGALFMQTQLLSIIYLAAASVSCLVWFLYKRNPPLF
jgi:hypothetical protein